MISESKEKDSYDASAEKDVIKIKNLSKYYLKTKDWIKRIIKRKTNKFYALDDVSLNFKKGKIVGLLGLNGAGKSTLMKCVLGFLKHQGQIEINEDTIENIKHDVFNHVAFIPDVNEIDERLTVEQMIRYYSGVHPKWNQERAEKLMAMSKLDEKKLVKNLSKGMKTKLYLLITLSLDVEILLLDEPTIGLDIAFKKEFYNIILGEYFDNDKLIIISTHQIEEIEFLLQEIIFINEGKFMLHEEIETLKTKYNIVTLPNERVNEIEERKPLYLSKSLGMVSGLFTTDVKIEGATYNRPQIADIFLGLTGGTNETI